ncbi:MAG: hypothetical protein EPO07_15870, partial [Verrucomicrobia bacterium]
MFIELEANTGAASPSSNHFWNFLLRRRSRPRRTDPRLDGKYESVNQMNKRRAVFLMTLLGVCLCLPPAKAGDPGARMQWWREARFGLFIHFGLYAIPG